MDAIKIVIKEAVLDEVDIAILKACAEKSSISSDEITSQFGKSIGRRNVYYRTKKLQRLALIRIERCHITRRGQAVLADVYREKITGRVGKTSLEGDECRDC